jgi:hypothetical protein
MVAEGHMHPRISSLIAGLEVHRATLIEAVESVPAVLREQRSAPDRWCVAEILEHLAISERRIARLLAKVIAEGQAAGLPAEDDASPFPPSPQLQHVLERRQRVAAPDVLHPHPGVTVEAAWAALTRSREELMAVVRAGDGLALGTLSYPHPFVGPLTMYQWIAFVGVHEARHAAQIRELAGV